MWKRQRRARGMLTGCSAEKPYAHRYYAAGGGDGSLYDYPQTGWTSAPPRSGIGILVRRGGQCRKNDDTAPAVAAEAKRHDPCGPTCAVGGITCRCKNLKTAFLTIKPEPDMAYPSMRSSVCRGGQWKRLPQGGLGRLRQHPRYRT